MVVREFTDSISPWEKVFDFGNADCCKDNVNGEDKLKAAVYNDLFKLCEVEQAIQQNVSMTVIVVYNPTNQVLQVKVNGVTVYLKLAPLLQWIGQWPIPILPKARIASMHHSMAISRASLLSTLT